jgi:hypothetical protein
MDKPKRSRSIWLRLVLGLAVSILAIFAVLKFVNLEDLKIALATVSWKFIVIIVLLDILGLFVRGKAWQTILGNKISLINSFFGVSEGYFLNNILPFRGGEIGRSFFVGRSSGLGTFYTLSSIVIERAFDIAFAALLIILTLPFLTGLDWVKPIAFIALAVIISVMAGLFMLTRYKEKVITWINKREKKSRIYSFVIPKTRNLIEGFSTIRKPSQFFLSLFWMAACWTVWSVIYHFSMVQVVPGSPLWTGAFIAAVLALGVAIPSAPAALGVFEAAFTGAIVLIGGSASTGFAYGLTLHLIQFVLVGIIGIWGLYRDGTSLSAFIGEVMKKDSQPNPIGLE